MILARAAWSVLALSALVYYGFWAVDAIRRPLPSCAVQESTCDPLFLSVEDVAAAGDLLLPVEWIARAYFALNILTSLAFVLVAIFIVWRRSDDRLALLVATILLCLGAFGYTPETSQLVPPGSALDQLLTLLAFVGYFGPVTALFYFPDGRFVPRWSRWVCLALILLAGIALISDSVPVLRNSYFWSVFPVALLSGIGVGVGSMVHRYRHIATPAQRQQIKWVAVGLSAGSLGVVTWILFDIFLPPAQPSPLRTALVAVSFPIIAVAGTFLPISIAVAVLRYRLWDVDVLIRRTLQYALLTGALALIYFGGVVLLQGILGPLTGDRNSPLVTVLTTLAIAALFSPLRTRIQAFIDRRFYRRKYNAERSLARFAAAARSEIDINRLAEALLGVVEETMQPERVEIRLKTGG